MRGRGSELVRREWVTRGLREGERVSKPKWGNRRHDKEFLGSFEEGQFPGQVSEQKRWVLREKGPTKCRTKKNNCKDGLTVEESIRKE